MSVGSGDPVFDRVVETIAGMQERAPESIRPESTFAELGIDSLNGFHLLCELEETLDITIPDDDARQLTSVGDVVELVRTLVAPQSS